MLLDNPQRLHFRKKITRPKVKFVKDSVIGDHRSHNDRALIVTAGFYIFSNRNNPVKTTIIEFTHMTIKFDGLPAEGGIFPQQNIFHVILGEYFD